MKKSFCFAWLSAGVFTGFLVVPLVASNRLRTKAKEGRVLQSDTEIYNGEPAAAGEFPAFALICYNGATTDCGGCGGVLITSQHVLTAGHCIEEIGPDNTLTGVRIGASQTRSDGTYMAVASTVTHPSYSANDCPVEISSDVAVLTLASPVTGVTPSSINQDPSYTSYKGDILTAIGYGTYNAAADSLSNYLRKTTVESQTDAFCANEASTRFGAEFYSDSEFFCSFSFNTGTCRGDSGGPIMDSTGLVWGVLSWGAVDCVIDSGDFWTEIGTYSEWIYSQTGSTPGPTPTPRPTPPPVPSPAPTILATVDCFLFPASENDKTFWGKASSFLRSVGVLGNNFD